jgi:DNA-binding NtrC family response regulator
MHHVLDYDWPGNVRELRTAIEHGVVMAKGPQITLRDLPVTLRKSKSAISGPLEQIKSATAWNLRDTETNLIVRALEECRENRSEAAKKLGISRRTLHRRLKELNLFKRS